VQARFLQDGGAANRSFFPCLSAFETAPLERPAWRKAEALAAIGQGPYALRFDPNAPQRAELAGRAMPILANGRTCDFRRAVAGRGDDPARLMGQARLSFTLVD